MHFNVGKSGVTWSDTEIGNGAEQRCNTGVKKKPDVR